MEFFTNSRDLVNNKLLWSILQKRCDFIYEDALCIKCRKYTRCYRLKTPEEYLDLNRDNEIDVCLNCFRKALFSHLYGVEFKYLPLKVRRKYPVRVSYPRTGVSIHDIYLLN